MVGPVKNFFKFLNSLRRLKALSWRELGGLRKVIAVAGMPGSGKGVVSKVAVGLSLPVYSCGDVIREEALKAGLALTYENLSKLMVEVRVKGGPAAVIKRLIPKLLKERSEVAVVEGVRSMDEVNELKKHFGKVEILGVHASPKTRFERLRARMRGDDPKTYLEFASRDRKELGLGLGNVLALADKMLINEESVDGFRLEAAEALKELAKDE